MPVTNAPFSEANNVKMNESDVIALIELSDEINSLFGGKFAFSLGYNCGYYDSTNSGDKAFLKYSYKFQWFNHLPRHEHVVEYGLSSDEIEELLIIGNKFEKEHGLTDYVAHYLVTPKHEGLWPPYEPLYANFEKFNIFYTSTPYLEKPATYGKVKIMKRQKNDLASYDCSYQQESREKIAQLVEISYNIIMNNAASILVTHQANYAKDRIANELLSNLIDRLIAQHDYNIVFLPAEKVIELYHEIYYSSSRP